MCAYDWIDTSLPYSGYQRACNGLAYSRSHADCRIATVVSAMLVSWVFMGELTWFAVGMLLWGMGFGTHESTLRIAVARQFPPARRASIFGVFDAAFGVAWFLGNLALGAAHAYAMCAVVLVSVVLQGLGLPCLAAVRSTTTTKETFA
ncbi:MULTISPECIES: hypothetical protein [Rhodanobacter]|uniref:Major facilitator superfamily (MFS) profile domain-containing protein n=1 Tax=Rhodanobacter thiooxydans TaxID=416169 RepID=A0A154QEN1_9GAMM|nr:MULTISPECIES: hypothetical protein [Rhodanobacter]KZC20242.1 hypothetical protein RHOFW104R3_26790 [Rhodanobacter denitrificans]KZC22673.1 hypothetical protein RHOFW104T7_17860 [Rhodanobacter thiooxydans]UJJ52766.1 hypothetical protein LRK52_08850 [Rhodanobacter denitrificans]UJM95537.1 hypothetical protein LRK32_08975 [Rhodanobacter denitrificans]UJM99068.1 hypothetical protein LRK44_08980 [Rhodanobacter denitrificans]